MSVGIIGAGTLGSSVARMLAKAGISAIIANRRGPDSLTSLVEEIGPTIQAGTLAEAAAQELVIVGVHWANLENVLGGLPAWNGRIVVDANNPVAFLEADSPDRKDPNNPMGAFGLKLIDLGGRSSSLVFRDHVPGARVVKAFNHLAANALLSPDLAGGKRVLFYSGDDEAAKAEVRQLIETSGFAPVDLGALEVGARLASPPRGPLSGANFVRV